MSLLPLSLPPVQPPPLPAPRSRASSPSAPPPDSLRVAVGEAPSLGLVKLTRSLTLPLCPRWESCNAKVLSGAVAQENLDQYVSGTKSQGKTLHSSAFR